MAEAGSCASTTLLAPWREQRAAWASLTVLYSLLRLRSMAEVASGMSEADLCKLARHVASAASSRRASPDALVMGVGVLVEAAGRLALTDEDVARRLETILSQSAVPVVVRAAAAWALGYLRATGAQERLRTAMAEGGELERAAREALGRIG